MSKSARVPYSCFPPCPVFRFSRTYLPLKRRACCFLHFPDLDEHTKGRRKGDEEGRIGVDQVEEDDALRERGREKG